MTSKREKAREALIEWKETVTPEKFIEEHKGIFFMETNKQKKRIYHLSKPEKFYKDISERLYKDASDGQICTTFEQSFADYMKLDADEKFHVNCIFYHDYSGMPISTCKDVIFYKMILNRLKIEKKRSKKDTKSIDAMFDQVKEDIQRFRNNNVDSFNNSSGDFDWKVMYYDSTHYQIQEAKKELQKCYFVKERISVFPDDEWKHVETGETIVIHDIVQHHDSKINEVVFTKDDDSKKYIMTLKFLRDNYDLRLMNLDYIHELFYDKNHCDCIDY